MRWYAVEGIPLNQGTIAGLSAAAAEMKDAFPDLAPAG